MSERIIKIEYITVVNIDWLDSLLSAKAFDPSETSKELFEKAVLATVIMVEGKIYKVLISEDDKDRIKWGQINRCYIKTCEPVYMALELFRESMEDLLGALLNKKLIEIPVWKFKTFGLYAPSALT
jgi:hypothetical protein